MSIYYKDLVGKTHELKVELTDTIESIKYKIQDQQELPPDQMIIIFSGKSLEDNRRLMDYNIQYGETISMVLKIRGHTYTPLYIDYNDKIKALEVCTCYRVYYLKNLIEKEIGINPRQQKLSFNGKVLDKENEEIAAFGIKGGEKINLEIIPDTKYDFDIFNIEEFKENFKNELSQLKNMGFNDEELNIQILRECAGNIECAVEQLSNLGF